jgi:hypothetical protein
MGRYKSNSGDAEYLEEAKEQVALENARVNRPVGLWFVKHWSPKAAILGVRITDHTDYVAITWETGAGHSHARFCHLVHYMINPNTFKCEATQTLRVSKVLSLQDINQTQKTEDLWERFS